MALIGRLARTNSAFSIARTESFDVCFLFENVRKVCSDIFACVGHRIPSVFRCFMNSILQGASFCAESATPDMNSRQSSVSVKCR